MPGVSDLLRRGRGLAGEWLGGNARARRRLDGSRAAILYYHRVIPEDVAVRDAVEPGMFVTPDSFESQLEWIAEFFDVLPLSEIVERLADRRPLPERACAITFDDGWRDNALHAAPALARRGWPATLYVVTDRVATEGAFWTDEVARRLGRLPDAERSARVRELGAPEHADPVDAALVHLKTLPEAERERRLEGLRLVTPEPPKRERELLDWEEIDRLAADGFEIESHTANHAILTAIPPDRAEEELRGARLELIERGHGRHGLLAYPCGAHDHGVVELAREAGYRSAVTIETGLAGLDDDLFRLPRLGIHQGIAGSREEFLYKVPGQA
ncbi:MAG: polysaccharide deacetylase family protein [Myxococcota bacterium]